MGGNVWQWCQDYFNNSPDYRVLRGASWRMRDPEDLLSSKVIGNKPDLALPVYGFRLVKLSLGSFRFFFVHRVMFNHPSQPLSTFSRQVQ